MSHPPAMSHGALEEVLPDVFFVMGAMRNPFFGSMWTFGRNMTVVRHEGALTLFNAVRLDDDGLAALEALGKVEHVVQLGSLHGRDDRFYVDRYGATMWAVEGMPQDEGLTVDRHLTEDGELPVPGRLFVFRETKLPEAILVLDREGGIAIACDSLQNWEAPDPYTDEGTVETMSGMGFYTPCNLGPAWMHVCEPKAGDFTRLREIDFQHALCGHGTPVIGDAAKRYAQTYDRVFGS